jgi:hypothetical protein
MEEHDRVVHVRRNIHSYTVAISGAMNHRFLYAVDIPLFTGWKESDVINKPAYAVKTENRRLSLTFKLYIKTSPVKYNSISATVRERDALALHRVGAYPQTGDAGIVRPRFPTL